MLFRSPYHRVGADTENRLAKGREQKKCRAVLCVQTRDIPVILMPLGTSSYDWFAILTIGLAAVFGWFKTIRPFRPLRAFDIFITLDLSGPDDSYTNGSSKASSIVIAK